MIEWVTLTSEEIGFVDRRLPVIIPLGLVEAHGPHLPLSVDVECGAYFARRVAEESGAILAPVLPYGFADEMREYPGTIGLKAETLSQVIVDLSEMFCFHGFTRQIFLSGHGANRMPVEMAFHRVWQNYRDLRAVYWNYWSAASVSGIYHADQGETEIAMAVGVPVKMDRVKDFEVTKPWYAIRSRFGLQADSGGINGRPSLANPENGRAVREQIVRILAEKVRNIIKMEQDPVSEQS
jgi:creatinine amidohydrolase